MSETQNTISSMALHSKLSGIQNAVVELQTQAVDIQNTVSNVNYKIDALTNELNDLRIEFDKMVEDQRKTANLQRAISELIRVRQEIEQKYGNYTVIRQTMLGVLQATDLALVKKTTISKVSEELMLSTPQYWLAPCLVAVAAWISNDRDLAERAVKEALKRDEEKTALAMALICRRNGRVQTGYEWLSIYFAKQSATNFTEESFTYIDAYVNGIFGPDERHTCQGYVSKWIDEVRGNKSNFEASQVETWKNYCARYSKNPDSEYPDLEKSVPEYGKIRNVVGRIQGLDDIRKDFRGIQEAFVDQEAMKKAVDAELIRLIGNYDKSEMEIRKEEEYLSLVKFFKGDEDRAKAEMQAREAKRLRHKLDFIEQMSSEITSGKETTPSKKKTAVTFLGTYINKGANQYIAEPKANFPNEVTVKIDKWSGKSKDGSEIQQLSADFEQTMNKARKDAIKFATTTKPKALLTVAIIALVLAIAAVIMGATSKQAAWLIFAAALLAVSLGCVVGRIKTKSDIHKKIIMINSEYDEHIRDGKEKLGRILEQWVNARNVVNGFDELVDTKVVA